MLAGQFMEPVHASLTVGDYVGLPVKKDH